MTTSTTSLESPALLSDHFAGLKGTLNSDAISPAVMKNVILATLERNGIDPAGIYPEGINRTAEVMSAAADDWFRQKGGTIPSGLTLDASRAYGLDFADTIHRALERERPTLGFFKNEPWIDSLSGIDKDNKPTDPDMLNAAGLGTNLITALRATTQAKQDYTKQLNAAEAADADQRFETARSLVLTPAGSADVVHEALGQMSRKWQPPSEQGEEFITALVARAYEGSDPSTQSTGGNFLGGLQGSLGNAIGGLGKSWPWLFIGGLLGILFGPMVGAGGMFGPILGVALAAGVTMLGGENSPLSGLGGGDPISNVRGQILNSSPEQLGYPDLQRLRELVSPNITPGDQRAIEASRTLAPGEKPLTRGEEAKQELTKFFAWRDEVASTVSGVHKTGNGTLVPFSRGDGRSTGLTARSHGLDADGTEVGPSAKVIPDMEAITKELRAGNVTMDNGSVSFVHGRPDQNAILRR